MILYESSKEIVGKEKINGIRRNEFSRIIKTNYRRKSNKKNLSNLGRERRFGESKRKSKSPT